jgi:predicted Fe-S protein YdhL (DUF1289 family)
MGKSSKSVPSPCIDVCKYKLKKGHCIGCGMAEREKKRFKKLDGVQLLAQNVPAQMQEEGRRPSPGTIRLIGGPLSP